MARITNNHIKKISRAADRVSMARVFTTISIGHLLSTMASSAASYSPKVQKRTLKGHRKQILCISHPGDHAKYLTDAHIQHHPGLLLSGSEDGTARLWDLRVRKTAYCIIVPAIENEPNDVTAVAFHPSIVEDGQSEESGDTTIFASRQDCMV